MQDCGILLLVIGVLIANVPAVVQQWRTDRPRLHQDALVDPCLCDLCRGRHGWPVPPARGGDEEDAERAAPLLAGAIMAWILYGRLLLVRLVPRYREPPRRLALLVLGLLFGCLGYLWG